MDFQFNNNSPFLGIYHIYKDLSDINNQVENESISHLLNNEEQDLNNDYLNNSQNFDENLNENIVENGIAAPIFSGNIMEEDSQHFDFSNFSLLDSSNICDVKQDEKNKDLGLIKDNNLEKKEDKSEKKETNFQMGDFITPLGDNDNIDNTNYNNLNNNSSNSINNIKDINAQETPGNNNLSNSSSSQNTNKSSVLSLSLSNNSPLSSKDKVEVICKTFCPAQNSEENNTSTLSKKSRKRKRQKSKTKKVKYKLEGIRKKIKSRLHKRLNSYFNKKLTDCGSKMLFEFFPQSFITDVSVIKNKAYLNLTMRKLLTMIFGTRAKDKEKVNINKKVLLYLDSNPEIRIKSGVDKFINSVYKDVINEYVEGKLFEEDVKKLKKEGKPEEYINKYIYVAKHLVEFYENGKIPKTPKG